MFMLYMEFKNKYYHREAWNLFITNKLTIKYI